MEKVYKMYGSIYMLTNYDLEELCDTYGVALRGIYMKDMLPQRAQNGNYIINLESSNGGKNNGTHWTCLVVHDKKAMFYDPYGAPPSIEIRDFVKQRKNTRLGFNNWVVQDLKSENCGYFVLSFLVFLKSNQVGASNIYYIANQYVNIFEDNTKNNDRHLILLFRMFKKKHPLIDRLYKQELQRTK